MGPLPRLTRSKDMMTNFRRGIFEGDHDKNHFGKGDDEQKLDHVLVDERWSLGQQQMEMIAEVTEVFRRRRRLRTAEFGIFLSQCVNIFPMQSFLF